MPPLALTGKTATLQLSSFTRLQKKASLSSRFPFFWNFLRPLGSLAGFEPYFSGFVKPSDKELEASML